MFFLLFPTIDYRYMFVKKKSEKTNKLKRRIHGVKETFPLCRNLERLNEVGSLRKRKIVKQLEILILVTKHS